MATMARRSPTGITPVTCFYAMWVLAFGGAGFLWSAAMHGPSDGVTGANGEHLPFAGLAYAAKPAYCRPDMPGCVPKTIDYVFMLASSESGQDIVMDFIDKHSGSGTVSKGMQLSGCNLAGVMGDATWCYSAGGDHHSPEVRDKTCKTQRLAMGLLQSQPMFQRLRCNFAVGQYDAGLLYTLPKEVLERTLIVYMVRDPVQQAAAQRRVFAQLDPDRMCPGTLANGGNPDLNQCIKLTDFIRRGFAGEHPMDALVKRLAGDYCCYQSELFSEDEARMQAALANFMRVGVVIDSDSMVSGLKFLGNVLGWDGDQPSIRAAAGLPREQVRAEDRNKAAALLTSDYTLYEAVQQRVVEQSAYLASVPQKVSQQRKLRLL